MSRRVFLVWAFLVFSAFAAYTGGAQETERPGGETFPAALLFEAAESAVAGEPLWRPGWPPELPPDAFRARGPFLLSAELVTGEAAYRFRRDREGRVREFPFLLGRELLQAELSYGDEGPLVAGVRLYSPLFPEAPAGELWSLDVLENEDARPALIRVSRGGSYSFILLQRGNGRIVETWYDEAGELLALYDFTLMSSRLVSCTMRREEGGQEERYFYDSRGLVTGVSGPRGEFSVLYYLEDLPRYWEYTPAAASPEPPQSAVSDGEGAAGPDNAGRYAFQWDEKGFLVRLLGRAEGEDHDSIDSRYEYTLDEKGNWIERREINMIRRLGRLVPVEGALLTRNLEYREAE
jgi:hypothetical protein